MSAEKIGSIEWNNALNMEAIHERLERLEADLDRRDLNAKLEKAFNPFNVALFKLRDAVPKEDHKNVLEILQKHLSQAFES